MQADAFKGYNDLYRVNRKPAPILEAACWSHGRRKFFDLAKTGEAPIAAEAVRRIDELFAIERTINGKASEQRLAVRREKSTPLVIDLEIWMRQQRALLSAGNDTAKAINYLLNRWAAFTRFLDDGRVCLTNNAAERALRGVAVGRRNWTFAGSDAGGHRAAAVYTVYYARVPRLFADLELAHGDGRFARLFRMLTKADLLILDDWGPDRLNPTQRRDLMEIVEDRYGAGSTLITSQLPVESWHEVIGEPTFADAILDRLVHNAYRLTLDGPSMRDPKMAKPDAAASATDTVDARATTITKPAKDAKR